MPVPQTDFVDDDTLDEDTLDNEETESDDDEALTDNVGDPSVEINVEELLQTLESEVPPSMQDKSCAARQRLEELMENKREKRDPEDFDDYIV